MASPICLTRASCSVGVSWVGCATLTSSLVGPTAAQQAPWVRMSTVISSPHPPAHVRVAGAALAALGGVALAVQGRINGQLGHLMHDGVFAALISFGTGTILLVAAV